MIVKWLSFKMNWIMMTWLFDVTIKYWLYFDQHHECPHPHINIVKKCIVYLENTLVNKNSPWKKTSHFEKQSVCFGNHFVFPHISSRYIFLYPLGIMDNFLIKNCQCWITTLKWGIPEINTHSFSFKWALTLRTLCSLSIGLHTNV